MDSKTEEKKVNKKKIK